MPVSVLVFGAFGALFGLIPPISMTAVRFGLLLSVPVILASLWSWWTYSWWARLASAGLWTIQFLAIAARAWELILGITWISAGPILIAYLLAWTMPILKPRISAFLWREQTAPQTRGGRTLLGLALAIGPSAGVLGAAVGLFGSRSGNLEATLAFAATIFSIAAIGFAFAISYQLWPDRPWASNRPEST